MAVSGDAINEVKARADIVAVVGEKVRLTPSGQNFKGLCPFHGEKSPSFTVNPQRQMFHCFGCGQGGSVIDFVMAYDRLTFPEALAQLAARFGVTLDQGRAAPAGGRQLAALESARGYYHNLLTKSAEGETARRYLTQRGFDEDIWQGFSLGYAPDGWQGFTDHALGEGFTREELLGCGLVKQSPSGRLYDLLRKRVIFPILDPQGRCIAFGGRVMDSADTPKYLNTPETSHYRKSQVLYGFHQARETFRAKGRCLLVEGYLDVIRAHQRGFPEAVATCGTALTALHLELLERHVKTVVLTFDGDAAGVKAALRSAALFLNRGVGARVVTLPDKLDPDDFLRTRPPEEFETLVSNATPMLEYLVLQTLKQHGATPEGKEQALRELAPLLAGIRQAATRDVTLQHLADLSGVKPGSILALMQSAPALRQPTPPRQPGGDPMQKGAGQKGSGQKGAAGENPQDDPGSPPPLPRETRHQRLFLRLILEERALLAAARGLVTPEELTDPSLRRLYEKWLRLADEEFSQLDPEEMLGLFPDVASPLRALLMEPERQAGFVEDRQSELRHLAARMKESRKDDLLRQLKAAQDSPLGMELMTRLQAVRLELDDLKKKRISFDP